MSEAPYMQLYVGDYLGDTRHLTTEQHGAYLLLLMAMWSSDGTLPNDEVKLARMAGVSTARWRKIGGDVMEFFSIDEETITQKRLKKEREKWQEKSAKRRDAGKRGGEAKALKDKTERVANAIPNATNLPQQNATILHIPYSREEKKTPHRPPDGGREYDAFFDRLWAAYPRRDGANPRKPARDRFRSACKSGADPEAIIAGADSYRRHCEARGIVGTPYVAQAATWLNQQRWLDDYGDPNSRAGKEHDEYLRILAE